MSGVSKLQALLSRLENVKGNVNAGYLGLAKTKGGAVCKCQGKRSKCPQCKYVKCRCSGGVLSPGLQGGAIQNFEGSGLTGGAIENFDGGRKKRGGRMCGAGLTGGVIENFDGAGLVGGRVPKGTMPPQLKGWLSHVAKVKASMPAGTAYKNVLRQAKSTYKK